MQNVSRGAGRVWLKATGTASLMRRKLLGPMWLVNKVELAPRDLHFSSYHSRKFETARYKHQTPTSLSCDQISRKDTFTVKQNNMADALKAEGNKLFAAKDFDGAV